MKRKLGLGAAGAICAGALAFAGAFDTALAQNPQAQKPQSGNQRVDLELVLAVDVSRSMDAAEHELQRDGYVQAFRHKDVIAALMSGPERRIAVTYMEWAAQTYQLIPWTIIDSEAAAKDFADKLSAAQPYAERRTSISTALYAAADLFDQNNITAGRRAIDVSGDGANNSGPPVEEARDYVLKKDITINGLPILLNDAPSRMQGYDIPNLDRYYKHCVIGGPNAFIAPVFNLKQLSATIRKKLVMEIAGLDIEPGAAPIQFAEAEEPLAPGITRVQLKLPTTPTDCLSGEKRRGGGWGGFDDFPPPPRPFPGQ
jgi:hypothetical protein